MNQNIIILTNGDTHEAWGSLTRLCRLKGWSHNYLKRKKFPFRYLGFDFVKVEVNKENGIEAPN